MYLAVDTETTGLSSYCQVLTAYFIILDDKFEEIDNIDLKIKYDNYNIYPKAMEINKINLDEHEKIADTQQEAKEKINNLLNKYNIKLTPLGHNIKFDLRMLKSNDLLCNDYVTETCIDTIDLCKELKNVGIIPQNQSISLSKISDYLGITVKQAKLHTAEYDIRLTIELFKLCQGLVI